MPPPTRPLPASDPNRPTSARDVGFWLYAGHLATVWGIALSNILHGLALLWTGWRGRGGAWRAAWRRRWPSWTPLLVPLAVYTALCLASIAFSLAPRTSLGELSELIGLTTLPLALVLVRGERAVRRTVDIVVAMALALALFGIVQFYATDYGALDNRIPGPFSHYQTFAGVLMIGDLLVLARLVSPGGWRRPSSWIALTAISWALMLTLTRGPWVGVAVTLTVYVLVRARRWMVLYVVAAALALTLMPASWSSRIASIGDLRDPSNYDRLCMLEAGLHMVEERPLLGLGPGMVGERYPIYRHPTAPRFSVQHLHNTFLQIAAERGLPALLVYLWLMAASAVLAYRAYRAEGGPAGERADLYLGALMVLLGFNLAGLFEANWRDTEVQRLVLFVLALPLCLRDPTDTGTGTGDDPGSGVDSARR